MPLNSKGEIYLKCRHHTLFALGCVKYTSKLGEIILFVVCQGYVQFVYNILYNSKLSID